MRSIDCESGLSSMNNCSWFLSRFFLFPFNTAYYTMTEGSPPVNSDFSKWLGGFRRSSKEGGFQLCCFFEHCAMDAA